MILGVGTDIVQIDRFRRAIERWQGRFLERLFSEKEREECLKWQDPVPHLAVKFAAKEAFGKAMGTGFGDWVSPREVEVLHDSSGAPQFVVNGRAKRQMDKRKVRKAFLSLSHDAGMGIAFVIMEG
jgi:holo-[acyl-carrier protein] synthase